MSAHFWIAQLKPVNSVQEAVRSGSPLFYAVPCAGPARYAAATNGMSREQIENMIRAPVGCQIAGTTAIERNEIFEPDCTQTRMNFICELDLDGDASTFRNT